MLGELAASEQRAAAGIAEAGFLRFLTEGLDGLIRRNYSLAEPGMTLAAACGVVAMPIYYIVWSALYPQPYENIWLRLAGSLMCLPFLVHRRWPRALGPARPYLWYLVVFYMLPFFFTFMMLMNGASLVWLLSALVALFLLVLLVDWISLVILSVVGAALAVIVVYWIEPARIFSPLYLEILPVFLFAMIVGGIFSYRSEILAQERLRAAAEVGSGIGQDLKSPLLGIKTGAISLQSHLPALLKSHDLALEAGLDPPPLPAKVRGALEHSVQRILGETDRVGTVIDMLQTAASPVPSRAGAAAICSMSQCIESALDLYPFQDERGRRAIQWRREEDFFFAGTDTLMVHLVMNLIRSGLQGIARAGRGQITLRLEAGHKQNGFYLRYADSDAVGIFSNRLFDPALLSAEGGIEAAAGLAFCQRVAEAFGGVLRCRSQRGGYREFVLRLPAAAATPAPTPQA